MLSGTEMAKNSSGLHTSGALMVNVSGLGIAENQDNSVCNKLICPTKSVASLAYGEFRILYGNIYLKIDGVTTIEEGRQWLESNDIIIIAQLPHPSTSPLLHPNRPSSTPSPCMRALPKSPTTAAVPWI